MTKLNLKRHLVSIAVTFGSTFLVVLALTVSDDTFTFSQQALGSLLLSALIAGVRAVAKLILELKFLSK